MRRLLGVLLSVCCFGLMMDAAAGEVLIDASTTIDGRYDEQGLRIVSGAGGRTTVQFVEPAYVEDTVYLEDDSVLEMSGGHIHDSLYLYESSVANLTGGSIGDTVHVTDHGVVTVNGAELQDYIYPDGFGLATILDGTLWGAIARGGSLVSIWGGDFGAGIQETSLIAEDTANIYVYGSDFNYPLGPIIDDAGTLSGVLADGAPFSGTFAIRGDANIILVPEPATQVLLAPALVALVCLGRRRRHVRTNCRASQRKSRCA